MKRIIHYVACLALSAVTITSYAQSQEQTTPTPRPIQSTGSVGQTPQLVSDPMVSDRLSRDLSTRNAASHTQTVNWYQTGYGYTGNYLVGSTHYMARYDQQGNYVETLRRTEWRNANVPVTLRNAFDQSQFKNHTVTGYWSVTDPGKSGYFLELRDKNGITSTVWSDSQGKFTTAPYSSTTAKPHN